jgi:hypothetical protein
MFRFSTALVAVVVAVASAAAQPVPQLKAGAFAQDVTPTKFPV